MRLGLERFFCVLAGKAALDKTRHENYRLTN